MSIDEKVEEFREKFGKYKMHEALINLGIPEKEAKFYSEWYVKEILLPVIDTYYKHKYK